MYTVSDIIGELTNAERLPREALKAASSLRIEMVGPLLAEVDKMLRAPKHDAGNDAVVFFAFYLLAEWRVTAAYRRFAQLLRLPEQRLEALLGSDGVTETAHRVIVSVFDGDPQPLHDLVLDRNVDEYVRSRMCEALAMLAVDGRLQRDQVVGFLRDAYSALKGSPGNFVWNGWQTAVAALGAQELLPLVEDALATEIDPSITDIDYFKQDLNHALKHPQRPWTPNADEYVAWGETVEEMSSWHCFSDAYLASRNVAPIWEQVDAGRVLASAFDGPYVNPNRNVGRNDPCPCGSGKKYKKCCLA